MSNAHSVDLLSKCSSGKAEARRPGGGNFSRLGARGEEKKEGGDHLQFTIDRLPLLNNRL